ncbi:MAG: hypothetical protein ACTSP3_02570 [Candidatus Heimdallarchaeaceae archaeon]
MIDHVSDEHDVKGYRKDKKILSYKKEYLEIRKLCDDIHQKIKLFQEFTSSKMKKNLWFTNKDLREIQSKILNKYSEKVERMEEKLSKLSVWF